jgi:uncharacterized protein (DUF924 family)
LVVDPLDLLGLVLEFMNCEVVLDFWFTELDPKQWWVKDNALDELIKDRFLNLHKSAAACELYHWRSSSKGRLAEIIVLDQFSRNIFRDRPESFEQDQLALCLAQEAVRLEAGDELGESERAFLFMPYMHSESRLIHQIAVTLFKDMPNSLDFELKHKKIIDRFGRYPHRNEILDRPSTAEELEFLKEPGSSF